MAKSNANTPDASLQGVTKTGYQKPEGSQNKMIWGGLNIQTKADWIVLRKKEKPIAEMFYTDYRVKGKASKNVTHKSGTSKRPITFVFNGGPGAASAFLHLGAMGPQIVYFTDEGVISPPPFKLVTNQESWIGFTDLVFIDPIGTGFSRIVDSEHLNELSGVSSGATQDKKNESKPLVEEKEFYQLNRDLDSICEFIERYISDNHLWDAPIYLAGESYGGYRTAKLARRIQEKTGVELSGVIIISPAMEWYLLDDGDYQVDRGIDNFCSMALAAVFHGKSRVFKKGSPIQTIKMQIESFATKELAHALLVGSSYDQNELEKVYYKAADYLGLPKDMLKLSEGRMPFWRFCRELLKDQRLVLGFYDASITAYDPYPDREYHQAPDPTLVSDHRVFTSAINHHLRTHIGIKTDRRYELLNNEVNASWRRDEQSHVFDTQVGATDDLRYAMSMNPHMKVVFTHGYYDLVTPYFSSERLVNRMKLPNELKKNLQIRHFEGGHMFYTWKKSRKSFTEWIKNVYK